MILGVSGKSVNEAIVATRRWVWVLTDLQRSQSRATLSSTQRDIQICFLALWRMKQKTKERADRLVAKSLEFGVRTDVSSLALDLARGALSWALDTEGPTPPHEMKTSQGQGDVPTQNPHPPF